MGGTISKTAAPVTNPTITANSHTDETVRETATFCWKPKGESSYALRGHSINLASDGEFTVVSRFTNVPLYTTLNFVERVSRVATDCMEKWETSKPTKITFTLSWSDSVKVFTVKPEITTPFGKEVPEKPTTSLLETVTFNFRDFPLDTHGQPLGYRDVDPANTDFTPTLPKSVMKVKPDEMQGSDSE